MLSLECLNLPLTHGLEGPLPPEAISPPHSIVSHELLPAMATLQAVRGAFLFPPTNDLNVGLGNLSSKRQNRT